MRTRLLHLRIGGPAAASLLVNALLIAALLNLGMGRRVHQVEGPALTVFSLAVAKGADVKNEQAETAAVNAHPPAAAAPSSEEQKPDHPPVVNPIVPRPQIVALPSSLSAATPMMMERSTPGSIAARAESTAQQSAPAPPASVRKGAVDGLDVKAPSGVSRSYAAKVRSWLYAHKIYPRRARMRREEGSVEVRFILDRTGMLVEGMIVRGSGHNALDEEAVAMMRRASPYPRAPSDLPGERIEFTAPIEFILPV